MAQIGLTTAQVVALDAETASARDLLQFGVQSIRGAAFADNTHDAILSTLAIGTEKLLKLSLGLWELHNNNPWPSVGYMKQTYGHQIVAMEAALRPILLNGANQTNDIAKRHGLISNDPVLGEVLKALDMYGRQGRFYHLDTLAGSPQAGPAPLQAWINAETAAINSSRRLQSHAARATTLQPMAQKFWTDIGARERVAQSVLRWWRFVAYSGRKGALGTRGVDFGSFVRPPS